jgi:hypothetical protein
MARAANGRKNWVVEATGQTYAQWQEAKLASLDANLGVVGSEDDDDGETTNGDD